MAVNALSLFSGIGGLDLAFEWAGGTVAAMCEIEPYCQKVLRKHWPSVPIFENVRELKSTDVGTVDVIYGGFPCQPFSVAGNQRGKDDNRYLWPEFSRLVGEIRPRWVVAENVPGILRIAADDVCRDLERQGYAVGIWDFEAAAVGAPHRRERREEQRKPVKIPQKHAPFGRCGRWELEPRLDRVASRLPHRVDRLRALGNAVVPQQAYPVFRAVMEADKQFRKDEKQC